MPIEDAEALLRSSAKRVPIGVIAKLLGQPSLTLAQLNRLQGFPGTPEPGVWDRRAVLGWLRRQPRVQVTR